jgi:hypothetical protein
MTPAQDGPSTGGRILRHVGMSSLASGPSRSQSSGSCRASSLAKLACPLWPIPMKAPGLGALEGGGAPTRDSGEHPAHASRRPPRGNARHQRQLSLMPSTRQNPDFLKLRKYVFNETTRSAY